MSDDEQETVNIQSGGELIELGEPNWSELEERHLGAMGGITFGVRPEYVVHEDNHMVLIRPAFDPERGRSQPTMVVSLVSNIFNAPYAGIEDFVDVSGFGTSEPNGQAIELFGRKLEGYSFVVDEGADDAPVFMYSAYGYLYRGSSAWQPFPLAELYLTEVPGGIGNVVLAVGYIGANEVELAQAKEIFDIVAPTLSLDQPLPTEATPALQPILATNYSNSPPDPLELPEDGAPILTQTFSPTEAGTYRLAHLGTPATVTLDDGWWVQYNFPGIVVFSANDSFGPGDRGFSIRMGQLAELTPVTVGPEPAGEPVDIFSDLDAFFDAPPPNIEVANVETVDLNGTSAVRFDLTIDPKASCLADDLCQYIWADEYAVPPESLRTGFTYRIWRIQELPNPITFIAASPDPSWLPTAEAVIATFRLN